MTSGWLMSWFSTIEARMVLMRSFMAPSPMPARVNSRPVQCTIASGIQTSRGLAGGTRWPHH